MNENYTSLPYPDNTFVQNLEAWNDDCVLMPYVIIYLKVPTKE